MYLSLTLPYLILTLPYLMLTLPYLSLTLPYLVPLETPVRDSGESGRPPDAQRNPGESHELYHDGPSHLPRDPPRLAMSRASATTGERTARRHGNTGQDERVQRARGST